MAESELQQAFSLALTYVKNENATLTDKSEMLTKENEVLASTSKELQSQKNEIENKYLSLKKSNDAAAKSLNKKIRDLENQLSDKAKRVIYLEEEMYMQAAQSEKANHVLYDLVCTQKRLNESQQEANEALRRENECLRSEIRLQKELILTQRGLVKMQKCNNQVAVIVHKEITSMKKDLHKIVELIHTDLTNRSEWKKLQTILNTFEKSKPVDTRMKASKLAEYFKRPEPRQFLANLGFQGDVDSTILSLILKMNSIEPNRNNLGEGHQLQNNLVTLDEILMLLAMWQLSPFDHDVFERRH